MRCPIHNESCSVTEEEDTAEIQALFGAKVETLEQHRETGPHLCFSGGSPPRPHTWRSKA